MSVTASTPPSLSPTNSGNSSTNSSSSSSNFGSSTTRRATTPPVLDVEVQAKMLPKQRLVRMRRVMPSTKEMKRKARLLKAYLDTTYAKEDDVFMDSHARVVPASDASALPKRISVEQLIAAMRECRCMTCIICSTRDCKKEYMQHGLSLHTPFIFECKACNAKATSPRTPRPISVSVCNEKR